MSLSIETNGDWNLQPSWVRLNSRIKNLLESLGLASYKTFTPSDDNLIFKLLDIKFKQPYIKSYLANKLKCLFDESDILRKAFWIEFIGIGVSDRGLFLKGICQDSSDADYIQFIQNICMNSVNSLTNNNDIKVDINSSTQVYFIEWSPSCLPNKFVMEAIQRELIRWEECSFGDMRIRQWCIDDVIIQVYRHICHRGNYSEKNISTENNPEVLDLLDSKLYDVEIDVWLLNTNELWLGHDIPQYKTSLEWLAKSPRRLIHCKDGDTFSYLLRESGKRGLNLHLFYHTVEDYALTSRGIVLVHPNKPLLDGSLCMMPEMSLEPSLTLKDRDKIFMICSDRVDGYVKYFN